MEKFVGKLYSTTKKFSKWMVDLSGDLSNEFFYRVRPVIRPYIQHSPWYIFPQCNYVPGWNRLGPVVAQFQGGWRFVAGRVTGRDTAYRDKPCRRADYGFQPSPLIVTGIALWFPSQPPRSFPPWNICLAIAPCDDTCYAYLSCEISRKWSVFFFFWGNSFFRRKVNKLEGNL